MSVTWKLNGQPVGGLGFERLTLRLINQQADTLQFVDAGDASERSYDEAPAITFSGGGGTGAAATATVSGGVVTAITLDDGGSGFTSVPSVVIAGEGSATAMAELTPTTLASITLANAGSNFTYPPAVAIAGGGGSDALATAVLTARALASIAVTNGGAGYTSVPSVAITGGGGSGATAVAVLSGGAVVGVSITDGGDNYTSAPTVAFSGGGGTGAAATAVLSDRSVASVAVTDAGSYTPARTEFVSSLEYPQGLALDSSGNLFVADRELGQVLKVTPSGTKTVLASISTATALAVDASGNVYASDYGAGEIRKITPAGSVSTFYVSGGFPGALAFDASGYLYVGLASGTIVKVSPAGSATSVASGLPAVGGLAVDAAGNVFATHPGAATITKITPAGATSDFATGIVVGTAAVFGPDGNLYVASSWLFGVYRVTPAGVVSNFLTSFTLQWALGLAIDASGNVYVALKSNEEDIGIVTKVSSPWPAVTLVGGGGTGATVRAVISGENTFTIASFVLTAAGTGYTSAPTVSVGGGAAGTATLTEASVASVTVTNGGTGYTSAPTVALTGGGGTGATADATVAQTVASITLTNPGSGFTTVPSVAITGGGGSDATAAAALLPGPLASITIDDAGTGFTSAPMVAITGGGGSGAIGVAVLTPTTIAAITLVHGGGPFVPNTSIVLSRAEGLGEEVWFRGHVRKPPRRLTPQEEHVFYIVEGPWQWLTRTPYLQNFKTADDPDDPDSALVDYLRGRAVLTQNDAGAKVDVQTFIASVLDYCAEAVDDKYGFVPFTGSVSASLAILVPWDEVTDLSCADAISRVLSLVPDAVSWFDYSQNPPVLHFERRQLLPTLTLPLLPPGGSSDFAGAVRNSIELTPLADQQKEGVVLIYIATNRANEAAWETYEIDAHPSGTVPNDPDVLVRTIQLAGSVVSSTVLTQKVDVDPIPSALVFSGAITSGGSFDSAKAWWRAHARELLGANVTVKSLRDGTRTLADGSAISGDCPNELVRGAVTDWMEDVHDVLTEDQLVSVTVEIEITDPANSGRKERVKKQLTASIKATDATTKTYTFTGASTVTPAEEVPTGLAQAIFDAISVLHYEGQVVLVEREATVNALVGRSLNLTGEDPAWETMSALVQEALISIDEGTTRLTVGPPRHLGVGDLIDLFRVNRTRPQPQSWESRTTGRSGSNTSKQGLSLHHPQTPVSGAERLEPRVFSVALTMSGLVPTQGEITTALESAYDASAGNTPVVGDVVHLTVSSVPKLSYRVTLTAISDSGVNVVPFTVDSVSYRGWLSQMGLF